MRFTYLWERIRHIDGVEVVVVGADQLPERCGFTEHNRHRERGACTGTSKQRGRDAIGAEKTSSSTSVVLEFSCRTAAQRCCCRTSPHSWLCKACSLADADQTDELKCDHSSRVWAVRSWWWWRLYEADERAESR